MKLQNLFDAVLRGSPGGIAIEFRGSRLTFGDLEQRSNRWANYLRSSGFQPGDRLAVYLPNSLELIDVYLACTKTGVIFTPINVLYREREIRHILLDAEPRQVLTRSDLRRHLPGETTPWIVEDLIPDVEAQATECTPAPLDGNATAALVYTSGTTGRSKGAILTHNNFAVNAVNLITCWRLEKTDRLLLPLPLFHVHGLGNGLHTWLASGFRLRLLDRFRKESIVEEFLDFRPTVFFGVPAMYERLLEVSPERAREIGGFLRLFVSGSAPLPARTLRRFESLYGHVVLERYGMTETLMNMSNPYEGERRPGSVGQPLPGVSIRLAEPGAERAPEPPGPDSGEILIKGLHVFPGYWRNPAATAAAFTSDGYFRSGDLATRSHDGYYTLEGRKTDLIISGGFNLYPREIEELIEERTEVAEAAVVGAPDALKGEVPVAYVVPMGEAAIDEEAIRDHCRRHLASFKVPRRVMTLDRLPRNALGKLQRHLLPALKPETR